MVHIGAKLRARKRIQVVARDNALRELAHLHPGEPIAQLRLPQQHDLQKLALAGLQVGQQPQLLQHVVGKVLRLIDDQHGPPTLRMGLEQTRVDEIDQGLAARDARGQRDPKVLAHRFEQLARRELGINDVGDVRVAGHLLQQATGERCLARAHLAGEQHESAVQLEAVEQVRERLAMALAHEQKAGIGRDREGCFGQAEMADVHICRWFQSEGSMYRCCTRLPAVSRPLPKRVKPPVPAIADVRVEGRTRRAPQLPAKSPGKPD